MKLPWEEIKHEECRATVELELTKDPKNVVQYHFYICRSSIDTALINLTYWISIGRYVGGKLNLYDISDSEYLNFNSVESAKEAADNVFFNLIVSLETRIQKLNS